MLRGVCEGASVLASPANSALFNVPSCIIFMRELGLLFTLLRRDKSLEHSLSLFFHPPLLVLHFTLIFSLITVSHFFLALPPFHVVLYESSSELEPSFDFPSFPSHFWLFLKSSTVRMTCLCSGLNTHPLTHIANLAVYKFLRQTSLANYPKSRC